MKLATSLIATVMTAYGQFVPIGSMSLQTDFGDERHSFIAQNTRGIYVTNSFSLMEVDHETQSIRNTWALASPPNGICLSPTGLVVTTSNGNDPTTVITNTVTVLDPASGLLRSLNPGTFGADGCGFSPDGNSFYVFAGVSGNRAEICLALMDSSSDVQNWKTIHTWRISNHIILTDMRVLDDKVYLLATDYRNTTAALLVLKNNMFVPIDIGMTAIYGLSVDIDSAKAYVSGLTPIDNNKWKFDTLIIDIKSDSVMMHPPQLNGLRFAFMDSAYAYAVTGTNLEVIDLVRLYSVLNYDTGSVIYDLLAVRNDADGTDKLITLRANGLDFFNSTPPTFAATVIGASGHRPKLRR